MIVQSPVTGDCTIITEDKMIVQSLVTGEFKPFLFECILDLSNGKIQFPENLYQENNLRLLRRVVPVSGYGIDIDRLNQVGLIIVSQSFN